MSKLPFTSDATPVQTARLTSTDQGIGFRDLLTDAGDGRAGKADDGNAVAQKLWDNTGKKIGAMRERPTAGHFAALLSAGTELGEASPPALAAKYNDFLQGRGSHKATVADRQVMAAMEGALASATLSRSSHNLDFGGDALVFFASARSQLLEAERSSSGLSLPTKHLLSFESSLLSDRARPIFAEHDIEGAFNELKEALHNGSEDAADSAPLARVEALLHERSAMPSLSAPERAKMWRDLALLNVAQASNHADNRSLTDAGSALDFAAHYLEKSRQLDGSAPDGDKIDLLIDITVEQIEHASR